MTRSQTLDAAGSEHGEVSSDVARRLSEIVWALMGVRFLSTRMGRGAVAAWLKASGLPHEPLELVDDFDADANAAERRAVVVVQGQ